MRSGHPPFDAFQNCSVRDFDLTIGLGVCDRAKLQLYPIGLIVGFELGVVKLGFVVSDDGLREPEPGDDVPPCEALDLFFRDGCQGFNLDPLREVVDPDNEEASLPHSWGEGPEEVKTPLGEGLGRIHRGEGDR